MYVCVCNAVSDRDIIEAIRDGAENLEHIQERLGASTGCGTCRDFTEQLIDRTLADDLAYAV